MKDCTFIQTSKDTIQALAITKVGHEELGISNYIHIYMIGKRIIVLCKKPLIDE